MLSKIRTASARNVRSLYFSTSNYSRRQPELNFSELLQQPFPKIKQDVEQHLRKRSHWTPDVRAKFFQSLIAAAFTSKRNQTVLQLYDHFLSPQSQQQQQITVPHLSTIRAVVMSFNESNHNDESLQQLIFDTERVFQYDVGADPMLAALYMRYCSQSQSDEELHRIEHIWQSFNTHQQQLQQQQQQQPKSALLWLPECVKLYTEYLAKHKPLSECLSFLEQSLTQATYPIKLEPITVESLFQRCVRENDLSAAERLWRLILDSNYQSKSIVRHRGSSIPLANDAMVIAMLRLYAGNCSDKPHLLEKAISLIGSLQSLVGLTSTANHYAAVLSATVNAVTANSRGSSGRCCDIIWYWLFDKRPPLTRTNDSTSDPLSMLQQTDWENAMLLFASKMQFKRLRSVLYTMREYRETAVVPPIVLHALISQICDNSNDIYTNGSDSVFNSESNSIQFRLQMAQRTIDAFVPLMTEPPLTETFRKLLQLCDDVNDTQRFIRFLHLFFALQKRNPNIGNDGDAAQLLAVIYRFCLQRSDLARAEDTAHRVLQLAAASNNSNNNELKFSVHFGLYQIYEKLQRREQAQKALMKMRAAVPPKASVLNDVVCFL